MLDLNLAFVPTQGKKTIFRKKNLGKILSVELKQKIIGEEVAAYGYGFRR